MACVPCFIIPLLLYIWHRFVQPIILRYWNPWEKKDAHGNVIKAGPEFPFECKGGVCPFVPGGGNKEKKEPAVGGAAAEGVTPATQSASETNATEQNNLTPVAPEAGINESKKLL